MNEAEERRRRKILERQLALGRWKGIPVGEENMRLIQEFDEDNKARGLALNSRIHYLKGLRLTGAMLGEVLGKSFKEVTEKEDMKRFVAKLSEGRATKSVNNVKICVKRFYQWLYDMDEEYPDLVKWMKPIPTKNLLKPKQLLTDEELKRLLGACLYQRDRALLMVIRELTPRPHEILGMRVGDVNPTKYGLMVMVDGKTGARPFPAIESAPDLQLWLNMHPAKDDPEAPLWCRVKGGKITSINYDGLRAIMRRVAKRAGVKKRVFWYLLRHTGLTEDSTKIPESVLRMKAGWVPGSRMPAVYVHLSGKDVEKAYLKAHGIKEKEEEKFERREPKPCSRCDVKNPFDAKFCTRCGMMLDVDFGVGLDETKRGLGDALEMLMDDDEFRHVLKKKIRTYGIGLA